MTPHPTDAGETLPALPDPTRVQLVVAGIAIVIAVILVGAVAARLVRRVELVQWWAPIAFVAGVVAADFASGIVHWSADTWGRADFPIVGPRLLVPFRVHHVNPDDFLRRRFLDTNGDLATLAVPALAGLLVIPLDSAWQHALAIVRTGVLRARRDDEPDSSVGAQGHAAGDCAGPAVRRPAAAAARSTPHITGACTTRATASLPGGATGRSRRSGSSGGSKSSSRVSRGWCLGPMNTS